MNWAIAGLVGRILLLGVERILVKKLGTGSSPFCAAFVFFFVGTLMLAPSCSIEVFGGWGFLPGLMFAGFIYAVAFAAYLHSLSTGEVSLVSPLYNFNVFFLAIAAWIFLGESLTGAKIAGIFLMLVGVSYLKEKGSIWASWRALLRDPACRFMGLASLLIAVGRVIDKLTLRQVSPIIYATLLSAVIAGWLFVFLLATGRVKGLVVFWKEKFWLSLFAGAVNGYSYVCLLYAMERFDVSVVEPASMLSMLVTLLLAKLHLKEALGARLLAVVVMIAGAWCLFL